MHGRGRAPGSGAERCSRAAGAGGGRGSPSCPCPRPQPRRRPIPSPGRTGETAPVETELGKINRVLRSLSELAKALISAQPEEVPARVMGAVFEHIPADRGFLMLLDEEGNLKPRVVHHRHGDDEKITISKTIADRVVQDRVAILTSDAQVDPRFATFRDTTLSRASTL